MKLCTEDVSVARKYALGMKFVGKAVGVGEGARVGIKDGKKGCVGVSDGLYDGIAVMIKGFIEGDPGNGDGLAVGAREGSPREGEGVGERLVTFIFQIGRAHV